MRDIQTISVHALLEDEQRRHLEEAAIDAMMAFVFKSDEGGAARLAQAQASLKSVARRCLNAGLCLDELPVRLVAEEKRCSGWSASGTSPSASYAWSRLH